MYGIVALLRIKASAILHIGVVKTVTIGGSSVTGGCCMSAVVSSQVGRHLSRHVYQQLTVLRALDQQTRTDVNSRSWSVNK